MVQYIEKYKQNIAIDMRKRGMSYSEIKNKLNIPKSTLSFWLKKIKLTEDQKKSLDDKRTEGAKKGSAKRTARILEATERIKISSAGEIKKISKRELWLMGLVLYWREGLSFERNGDLKNGVHFSSSDPDLMRLFLKWLKNIGGIKNEEIMPDIFIENDKNQKKDSIDNAIDHWSRVTGFSRSNFSRIYLHKAKSKRRRGGRKISKRSVYGFLRIRVRSSSMLARQISGWIKGILDGLVKE